MTLTVNNQMMETTSQTLSALAMELQLPAQGVAMAVNNSLVPKAEWENCILKEGMQIIIIKAACGG